MVAQRAVDADRFAVGTAQRVGQYSYYVLEDRWEWSEEMYHVHGFEPGEVVPTTELVMSHKQPGQDEMERQLIADAIDTGEPFGFRNRIVDAGGHVRTVVIVGAGVTDDDGELVEVRGYMVDVTEELRSDCAEAVAAALEHRAAIDQAKGMLMLLHGMDEDAAFALLQKASCDTNTKLHLLAARLVEALTRQPVALGIERLGEIAGAVLFRVEYS